MEFLLEAYLLSPQKSYLAMMLFNTNVDKRANMITPDKLFPLPQDVYLERGKPKSTRKQYEKFLEKVNKIKKK